MIDFIDNDNNFTLDSPPIRNTALRPTFRENIGFT